VSLKELQQVLSALLVQNLHVKRLLPLFSIFAI